MLRGGREPELSEGRQVLPAPQTHLARRAEKMPQSKGTLAVYIGGDEVFARHAEAARGDLLDRRVLRVAVGEWNKAIRVFTALARVAHAADAVHSDGERFVSFLR